jgi:glycosyltransferase involved in cell wall biosynthesis
MRIAQVSHSLNCGGSMALVVALSCELAKRGHEVDVVCLDRRSGSAHENLWIARLVHPGIRLHFLDRERGAPGVAAAVKLWRLVQRRRYDVLHSHLPMPDAIGGLIRRLSPHRLAHVVTVHNTHEPRSRVLQALASGANVVYCSEAVGRKNPLPGITTTVIPNGIPPKPDLTPVKSRSAVRREIGLSNSATVVIGVGRLCPQKNFAATLQALAAMTKRASIADLHCLICGDGEERGQLQTRVRELGLEGIVHLMGARTDLQSLLGASDVFLSTSRHEGMPLSVLEALSAGLPCVLSDIQEHHELAGSMPGCAFTSLAPESITLAVESVLRHPIDPYSLRRQRATLLQKHSIEQCADLYDRLYQASCDSRLLPHLARP